MEFIDLYDENKKLTNIKICRGEKYAKSLYKLSVHFWIVNSLGEFYIQKRSSSRQMFPNKWENPGGGVLAGENSEDALKREFYEELGIKLNGEYCLIDSIKREKDFVDIYLVKQNFSIDQLNLQVEEVAECKWVNQGELKKMIKDNMFCSSFMDSYLPMMNFYRKHYCI